MLLVLRPNPGNEDEPMNTEIVMPDRIARLKRDSKGRPVPYFVAWKDGVPDFKVVRAVKVSECTVNKVCWICGEKLGKFLAFVIGPMCSVNRLSAEPPSHFDCAKYAAQACPFLAHPQMQRRESLIHTTEEVVEPPGIFLKHNPGVTLVWVTTGYRPFMHNGGLLFDLGEPTTWIWYAEGRLATRAEVASSFETGLMKLHDIAEAEGQLEAFDRDLKKAMGLWPIL